MFLPFHSPLRYRARMHRGGSSRLAALRLAALRPTYRLTGEVSDMS